MGDFTVIGVTSDILKGLLFLNLKETFNTSFSINNIVLASPKEIEDKGIASVRLSLFLYQIVENAYVKNRPMENLGTGELKYPPLSLNFYYLITPYSDESQETTDWDRYTILGKAMQTLYDNAILRGSALLDVLKEVQHEDYYDQIDRICITLNPISLDDLTKIWNSLDTPMKLSVGYEVRVVMVESERKKIVSRIVEKHDDYYQKAGKNGE
ncbi:MAG: DUF4255 domain-containing protein [candidate division WOR-3 bacterium]